MNMVRRILTFIFTFLGIVFAASILASLLLYMLVGAGPSVPESAVLILPVGGDLAETSPDDVVAYISGPRRPTLRSTIDALRKAKADARIEGVLLKPTGFASPYWGKVQELRDALLDFRASGKPVYAYLEYGGDQDYLLATGADKVFLMPSTPLQLAGVASYELFLRGTLDWIGVRPDLQHIGDYKTAVNTFTEKSMTDAHREMNTSLALDLYETIVSNVAQARQKSVEQVRALIDEGPFLPDQAVAAGLVDGVGYEDEVADQLRKAAGIEEGGERAMVSARDYAHVTLSSLGLNQGPRIAVIYASGTIVSGDSGFDPVNGPVLGSDTIIEHIRAARRDSSTRAIVLRVDSPGGSATASDAIWRELMREKAGVSPRPLVVSMSDLAASGGYYIAMPADAIVAQPLTLTGSIGIFGGKFVTGGAYSKLGANIESTSVGRHAEMNSPARAFNEDELRELREQLQSFYTGFVQKAASSRRSTPEQIDAVARGRVWTGNQAKTNGLVDELGGLSRAIAVAKSRAKIPDESEVEVVVYPPVRSFYELLSEQISGAGEGAAVSSWLAENLTSAEKDALSVLRGPWSLFRRGEALALMPFRFR
jgi:protease-4